MRQPCWGPNLTQPIHHPRLVLCVHHVSERRRCNDLSIYLNGNMIDPFSRVSYDHRVMVAFSVVMTVVVLNFHHRSTEQQQEMPDWVSNYVTFHKPKSRKNPHWEPAKNSLKMRFFCSSCLMWPYSLLHGSSSSESLLFQMCVYNRNNLNHAKTWKNKRIQSTKQQKQRITGPSFPQTRAFYRHQQSWSSSLNSITFSPMPCHCFKGIHVLGPLYFSIRNNSKRKVKLEDQFQEIDPSRFWNVEWHFWCPWFFLQREASSYVPGFLIKMYESHEWFNWARQNAECKQSRQHLCDLNVVVRSTRQGRRGSRATIKIN